MSALGHLRVVDLSVGIAGPVAAMLFADFGADVVKLDHYTDQHKESCPGSAVWDRGKRRATRATSGRDHQTQAQDLIVDADVVIVNDMGRGGWAGELTRGLKANAGLVVINVTTYPGRPNWSGGAEPHGLLAAATGVALRQTSYSGDPVELVSPHLLYMQGLWAAVNGAAALAERQRSEAGQIVTVTGLDAMMVMCPSYLTLDPDAEPRRANFGPAGPNPFYSPYQTADGSWIFLGTLTRKFQEQAIVALDLNAIAEDPRLEGSLDNVLLTGNREWVRSRLQERFLTMPAQRWLKRLTDAGVPVGPILRSEDWLDHPQVQALGMRVEIDDASRGRVTMPGVFVNLHGSPGAVHADGSPPGDQLERCLWNERTVVPSLCLRRSQGAAPLAGIRVLDLGMILAGPYAGHLLAGLGAEVIKVEPPQGDPIRGRTFTYNRGLRSLSLDLRAEHGRQILQRLAGKSDIVIDNYRPGVLQRLGASHAQLTGVNPALITCSITAFGESGPMAGMPGFDPILQAASGMMAAQGGASEPVFQSISVNDVTAAVLCAFGAVTAYLHRERTGKGQHVGTSLLSASLFMQMATKGEEQYTVGAVTIRVNP